jgi:membrane fusion protein (multidrug efflux system)
VFLRAYLIAALLLLTIFGGIAGYLYRQFSALSGADFTPPPATIAASVATGEQWNSLLTAIGTIRAVRGVELSTEESGEVIAVDVRSGEQVEPGQLLITLNDKIEQASRESQIASLELARLLFERDQQLVKQKSIPQSQYDRSKADYERAIAQLAETEARLENKRIHAPFAGTAGIVHVQVGDYVVPGDAITTLQDLSELEIDFTVPARHYPRLRPGLVLDVRVAAFPDRTLQATLQALDASADPNSRNLLLRAGLEPDSGLLPGMFAELTMDLDSPSTVVTVPETAVTYSLQGSTVFVIEQGEEGLTVAPRVVRTGGTRDGRIAILEGLAEGARVVTAGQNKLFRGAPVVIDETVALEGL